MRIGILGGSFNPIHNGHIRIGYAVLQVLKLDKIWIMPTGQHPIKSQEILLETDLRVDLIQTAIEKLPGFEISFADLDSSKPSYTDELIQRLQIQYPEDEYFFIIGADNVPQLPQWHNWKWLLDNVRMVAVNRPDTELAEIIMLDYASQIIFVTIPPIPISSTDIRQCILDGKSITGLVPEIIEQDVLGYYGGRSL